MISIRKYLDGSNPEKEREAPALRKKRGGNDLLSKSIGMFLSALAEMGRAGKEVCPASGQELQDGLDKIGEELASSVTLESIAAADTGVQKHLQHWGRSTARHFQKQAGEIKEMLLVMAHAAESVGQRDQRCAEQIHNVTTKLRTIANLDDLTLIRSSIEQSASELKVSIDRMTAEGKAMLEGLQKQVSTYQAKLEEAEQAATSDALTRLRNRLWVEDQLEKRVKGEAPFCAAILDIDEFKSVNDDHGHLVGDELLKHFAGELRSALRSTDIVGRWGGDEFIVVLDCKLPEAESQIERLRKWVCGSYTLEHNTGPVKLNVRASIGLAEWMPPENMKDLLDRADAEMYKNKAENRVTAAGARN